MHVAYGKEVALVLVLDHRGDDVGELACLACENLALAVDDVFLEIIGYAFRRAEEFLRVGDIYSRFFGETEEIVDCCLGSEDDGGVVGDINFLSTEILSRQAFHFDERTEYNIHAILFGNLEIRRFFGFGLRLGN